MTNCTVSGNIASETGGGVQSATSGTMTIGNTIVAGNTASHGPDVYEALGVFASEGNNLIGETNGSSGWVGSDLTGTVAEPLNPLLAPLGNYGGPTQTMALLPGSPAIDAGNNALIPRRRHHRPARPGLSADRQRDRRHRRLEFGGSTGESQTISFGALANQTYGATTPVDLTATASSNLPVSFAILSGPATISGSVLTITGAGNIVVEAVQTGNSVYAPGGTRGPDVDGQYGHAHDHAQCGPNQGLRRGRAGPQSDGHRVRQWRFRLDADRRRSARWPRRAARSATTPSRSGSLSAGPNYALALAASPPTFAVTRAPLAIQPTAGQTKVYGAAVPGLTATASGYVNGDSASLLTGAIGTMATASSAVGTYAFTLGSLSAGPNYTLALAASPPTFAVTRRRSPSNRRRPIQGLRRGGAGPHRDGHRVRQRRFLLAADRSDRHEATASSAVGTYAFTLGSLSAGPNYTLALAASPPTFAVTPASLVITANSASIASGQALPVFTASYAGFVNGDTSASLTAQPALIHDGHRGEPGGDLSHHRQRRQLTQLHDHLCARHAHRDPLPSRWRRSKASRFRRSS